MSQAHEEHRQRPYLFEVWNKANTVARQIAEDYSAWEGSLRDFFKYESLGAN